MISSPTEEKGGPSSEMAVPSEIVSPSETAGPGEKAPPGLSEVNRRGLELAVLAALAEVMDPELGMNVVELALIRQVILGTESSEIKMVMTTPFCPYAGELISQVGTAAESVLGHPVKVTLLAERWDPREAGLEW